MNKLKYVVSILTALTISSVVTANEIKMALELKKVINL
jgi:hypothetical protein